jgi:phage minor structural protein, N-terminal domain protein|nr:MAG TPA: tail protein [Caudoviricetes sp.]
MIYLFNQTEELIDVIDEASLADFTHTIELNRFDRASFEIPVDYKPNIIKEAQFFGFQSRDRAFCLFRISEKSYDIGLTIQGIDRAESDLHSFIIEDKRPGGTASDVLREILKGTGYQLGDIDGLTINGNMSFYYISVRQALVKLIESYACEFRVRYTFVENKIIGRYIDLNQRFGRVTGHQFEYGSNILNVIFEESSDDVVTALIGRGKGEQSTDESGEATGGYGRRIQFKDVSWSVAKGDPVDKPAGQNYVANETARNIYGLHQNGVIKHRFGVYTNEDIEDPVELLKATYKELKRLSVPIVTFKANLLDLANAIEQDIWIGDSVGIVRDQIGIAFEARIHKLIIDKLDDNRSAVELGDYQTLQAKDRFTRQQVIKDAVSGFSESLIKKAIANEVDRRNKEFDEKIRVNKLEFDNELQRAKERAEEVKRQISSEIDKKFQSFDNASIQEARREAEEALRNAGASSLLAQEAKRISERARADITNLQASSQNALSQIESFKTQYGTKLNEVKSTADGLFTKMGAVETYISKDGQRQESLQRYARNESARQVSAVREQISRDYVGKSSYQEDVRGLERRFSAMSTQTNNDIATKIAQYKQTVDGQFASITSQIAGKANQVDFQRVKETSQLYERIIGSNENDISNKVARMAMTNQLFQVEVSKNEGLKTVQRQLAGSWSVQNINSAGDIISGINLGANGYNRFDGKLTHITGETLIDKAVIKSAMVDKLKTANFEAGSVTSTIIGAEAVTADKVRMDQAFAKKLVASNIFTDMLAAKEAFINKLRSVVVTATFLEGFQGKIGGFRFGQYANRNGYFITGINSVSVGMGNGTNAGANRNAFWANWGESLDTPGPKAWYVNTDGKMYCRNDVDFYSKVDFASTSKVNFYSRINAPRGIWIGYDDVEGEGDNPDGGYNRVVWWSQIVTGKWRQHAGITTGSDRKLKDNIEPTSVKALDKINALNLVAFDYIKDKTHEEIGLIAQEVLNIIPGSVEKYEGEDNHLTINYSKFVPYLIKAVQELNQKLEEIA